MRLPLPIALAAACSAVSLPCLAAPKGSVLVLSLEAPGLAPDLASFFDAEVRAEITDVAGRRLSLLPKPAIDFEGMRLAAGCPDDGPTCLSTLASAIGANAVFRTRLIGDAARARVEVTFYEVNGRRPEVVAGELTEIGPESAIELRLFVARALGVMREAPLGTIGLFVASDVGKLEGAELMLDDKKIGPSGLLRVAPGVHRLEVRQRGFETFLWSGAVRPGRETRVAVSFRPSAAPLVVLPSPPGPGGSAAATKGVPGGESPAGPRVEGSAERSGRTFVLPAILAGVAAGAVVFGSVQYGAMKSAEQSLKVDCLLPENASRCAPVPEIGDSVCDASSPLAACQDGERAAILATASFIGAGVLAAAAATFLYLELTSDPSPASETSLHSSPSPRYGGAISPAPGGAMVGAFVQF